MNHILDYSRLLAGKQVLVTACAAGVADAIEAMFTAQGASVFLLEDTQSLATAPKADILVCGEKTYEPELFHEMAEDAVPDTVCGALAAVVRAVRHTIGHMMRMRGGTIVSIVSSYGDYVVPGVSREAAASGAITAFIRCVAMDYCKYNIRANCIRIPYAMEPAGGQYADLQLLRREGTAEDVAASALFLASPLSAFITGECLPVNGGGFVIGHNQVWEDWLRQI